jgi:hypothetical protein
LLSRFVVLLAVAASVAASTASASGAIKKGIFDEANTLYGDPPRTFPILEQLGTKYVRMNLHWGGRFGVSGVDPTVRPTDPNDGQYDWGIYDRAVQYAAENGIQVVFSIVNSPPWANGRRIPRYAPTTTLYINHLRDFAHAAAQRYSGTYRRPSDAIVLPAVRHWLAWNEPNNPIWLQPQVRRGRFVSPQIYARVCNAIVTGIKSTFLRGERVACGVTAPRGNNSPRASRPSMSPLAFVRGMKRYGAKGFDAYAHHPYYGKRTETPATSTRSCGGSTAPSGSGSPSTATRPGPSASTALRTRNRRGTCARRGRSPSAIRGSTCSSGSCSRTTRTSRWAGSPAS